jgi:hypothetical protein
MTSKEEFMKRRPKGMLKNTWEYMYDAAQRDIPNFVSGMGDQAPYVDEIDDEILNEIWDRVGEEKRRSKKAK